MESIKSKLVKSGLLYEGPSLLSRIKQLEEFRENTLERHDAMIQEMTEAFDRIDIEELKSKETREILMMLVTLLSSE